MLISSAVEYCKIKHFFCGINFDERDPAIKQI